MSEGNSPSYIDVPTARVYPSQVSPTPIRNFVIIDQRLNTSIASGSSISGSVLSGMAPYANKQVFAQTVQAPSILTGFGLSGSMDGTTWARLNATQLTATNTPTAGTINQDPWAYIQAWFTGSQSGNTNNITGSLWIVGLSAR